METSVLQVRKRNVTRLSHDSQRLDSSTEFETSTNLSKIGNASKTLNSSLNPKPTSNGNGKILMVIILLAVIGIGYAAYTNIVAGRAVHEKYRCIEFMELSEQFPNQDGVMWKSIRRGVEGVLNDVPQRPSTFLLAYNDPTTSNAIMEKILNATVHCMHSNNSPLKLDGNAIAGESTAMVNHGDIIDMYEVPLKNAGVMYVSNINQISMPAAQMFHVFCDTITPLVARAVIFLTIYIDEYERNIGAKKLLGIVEKDLKRHWVANASGSNLENTLEALIVRVTDQVFLLHPEKRLL